MQICWRLDRCTVRDVLREDLKTHTRDYRTILTFMTRMANKGWLSVEKEGNTNCYTPAIAQREALKNEIRRFLDEIVGPEPENRLLLDKIIDQLSRR
jgi:predicted transcriptional regulator